MAALPVVAAEAAAPEASSLTLKNIILQGGSIMYVIVGLSFVTVMLIILYLLMLRKNTALQKSFVTQAQEAIEAGDLEALNEIASNNQSIAARCFAVATAQFTQSNLPYDPQEFQSALEEEGGRQVTCLWSRLQYLIDISTVAPMCGLLGTVWGMMISFTGLESGINMINKADRLASGVSQAMFTTFGGLIVGIVAIVAYALFRGYVNQMIANLESTCATLQRQLNAAKKAAEK